MLRYDERENVLNRKYYFEEIISCCQGCDGVRRIWESTFKLFSTKHIFLLFLLYIYLKKSYILWNIVVFIPEFLIFLNCSFDFPVNCYGYFTFI